MVKRSEREAGKKVFLIVDEYSLSRETQHHPGREQKISLFDFQQNSLLLKLASKLNKTCSLNRETDLTCIIPKS